RSTVKSSSPARCLKRRSISATSSRQSIPSTLKIDSAWISQVVQTTLAIRLSRSDGGTPGFARILMRSELRRGQPRPCAGRRAGQGARPFFDVFEALLEESDDMLIVEGVEHHLAVAARPHEAHATEQPQLVRDERIAEPEQPGQIADAQLGPRQRVEDA